MVDDGDVVIWPTTVLPTNMFVRWLRPNRGFTLPPMIAAWLLTKRFWRNLAFDWLNNQRDVTGKLSLDTERAHRFPLSLMESHLLVVRVVSQLDFRVKRKLRAFPIEIAAETPSLWADAAGSFPQNTSTVSQVRQSFKRAAYLSITDRHSPDLAHNNSLTLAVRFQVNSFVLRLLSGIAASKAVRYLGR